jgi:hypothetical protein
MQRRVRKVWTAQSNAPANRRVLLYKIVRTDSATENNCPNAVSYSTSLSEEEEVRFLFFDPWPTKAGKIENVR